MIEGDLDKATFNVFLGGTPPEAKKGPVGFLGVLGFLGSLGSLGVPRASWDPWGSQGGPWGSQGGHKGGVWATSAAAQGPPRWPCAA